MLSWANFIAPRALHFSQITDQLYIGTTPRAPDYNQLRGLGITLVINLRIERPPYRDPGHPPLPVLWLPVCDTPLAPIPLKALQRGVAAAQAEMARGGLVYAHCAGGVHRAPALAAAILIAQGHSAASAMQWIKARRAVAQPEIWYIRRRIEAFEREWELTAGSRSAPPHPGRQ
jgi:protein tyrosine phosphatase (PTP) superfamily phosphohydrolase (DUF442 family)